MPLYMIPFGSKIIFSTARIRYNLLEVFSGVAKSTFVNDDRLSGDDAVNGDFVGINSAL